MIRVALAPVWCRRAVTLVSAIFSFVAPIITVPSHSASSRCREKAGWVQSARDKDLPPLRFHRQWPIQAARSAPAFASPAATTTRGACNSPSAVRHAEPVGDRYNPFNRTAKSIFPPRSKISPVQSRQKLQRVPHGHRACSSSHQRHRDQATAGSMRSSAPRSIISVWPAHLDYGFVSLMAARFRILGFAPDQ